MPIDVVLLRHGQPEYPSGRYPDPFEMGLSDVGRFEAVRCQRAIQLFNPDLVVTSDFQRAIETAELATAGSFEIEVCADLRERVFLSLVGQSFEQIIDRFGHDAQGALTGNSDDWNLPGEETYEEAHARVVSFFRRISAAYPGARVLAVCHGGPHGWMLEWAFGSSLRSLRTYTLGTGHFSRFVVDGDQCSLISMNLSPLGVDALVEAVVDL